MLWKHISTVIEQLLAVGPRTHLREEVRFLLLGEIHIVIFILVLIVSPLSPVLCGKGLHHKIFLWNISPNSYFPPSLQSVYFSRVLSVKLAL